MKKLIDVIKNPSGFDSMANYSGIIPHKQWLVVLTHNRDSDVLTESNWACALERLGGESDTVQIFNFGHWACGWWEALCVIEGSEDHAKALKIESDLEGYPILDENDFSEREVEEANEVWKNCYDKKERLNYIRKFKNQFEFHDFKDLMCVIRGEYFNGCASELLN